MPRDLRQSLIAVGAALLLVALSVVSAARMAPEREDFEQIAAFAATGVLSAEICGMDEAGHDHRCPFCHNLPEAPRLAAPDRHQRITRVILPLAGHDLVLGPQHITADVSSRAPPRRA